MVHPRPRHAPAPSHPPTIRTCSDPALCLQSTCPLPPPAPACTPSRVTLGPMRCSSACPLLLFPAHRRSATRRP
eukprot:799553-Rhodomonas_salina.1